MIKEAIVRALRWIVKGTPNVRITANIVETAPQNRLAGKKVEAFTQVTLKHSNTVIIYTILFI